MRKLLRCLVVAGFALGVPALTHATKVDPVPPPNCSDICWNLDYRYASCKNGTVTMTCWQYLN